MKPVSLFLCVAAGISAQAATFNMLSCCPGENNATQARFVWHSDSDACTLWYAKASAPGSALQTTCESVSKPVTFRNNDVSYYKYTAALSSLDPGTEYIYWVEAGGSQSGVQRFKTAGTSGSYNFLWMSDVHSHPDNPGKMNTVELLRQDAESRTASSGGIDFVLFSGDAVKYGSRYDNWQQWNGSPAVTNYMFAMIPGNKEYYYTGSSTFYDYYWYLAVKNNPPNGPGTTEQEGCYWFLRDSVLFVGIDSLIHKGSRMARYGDKTNVLRDQTNWFDRVVSEQKSKKSFRYLVVVQHDPWFVYAASKDSFDKSRGNYDTWRHVFDKHKVDLALSGDEHNYIRTKPLRSDAANSDGTIYMVAGQIEESNYSATITTSISDYGNANATKYFDCMGATDASCGAAWIEVRPDSLKVTEFWDKYQSPNYKKYDSVTITPKDRGFVYDPGGVHGMGGDARQRCDSRAGGRGVPAGAGSCGLHGGHEDRVAGASGHQIHDRHQYGSHEGARTPVRARGRFAGGHREVGNEDHRYGCRHHQAGQYRRIRPREILQGRHRLCGRGMTAADVKRTCAGGRKTASVQQQVVRLAPPGGLALAAIV